MTSICDQLLTVQESDHEIAAAQQALAALAAQLTPSVALRAAQAAATEAEQTLTGLLRRQRAADTELEDLRAHLARVHQRLYGGTVSNSRELQTLEHDAAHRRSHIIAREDALMELMLEVDAARSIATAAQDDLASAAAAEQRRLAETQQQHDHTLANLAAAQQRRQQHALRLPDNALALYEQLRRTYHGKTVVRLVGDACFGCGTTLASGVAQHVRHDTGLPQCPSCRRLLVF